MRSRRSRRRRRGSRGEGEEGGKGKGKEKEMSRRTDIEIGEVERGDHADRVVDKAVNPCVVIQLPKSCIIGWDGIDEMEWNNSAELS